MTPRIMLDYKLETNRIYLRSRIFDDNAFVYEATRYEGFNDGMPWNAPLSIKEMEDRYYLTLENWINAIAYSFVIIEKNTDYRLGIISIRKTEILNKWDIGYWIHPEKQRMGFMKEAASKIIEFGFLELMADSIQAKYALWNIASERVLLNCGMKNVEFIEKGFEKNGEWVKENRMEITKLEWELRK